MAERTSWAVGSDTERILTVEDARIAWAGLLTPARSGFQPAGNADRGRVFATSPTPNGVVHVEPFTYHLRSVRGGGVYTIALDAVKDIDILATAPPDSANDRHDLIVAQQSDVFFGDSDSLMRVRHVVGEASGTPQDPQVSGSPDLVRLARVVVHANATEITQDDIQGLRPVDRATVALGGVLPVPDQAARNTVTDPYEGLTVYRRERDWVEVFDGAGWRVVGVALANPSDISHPYTGQIIVNGATPYRYDGTTWVPLDILTGRIMSGTGAQYSGIASVETHLAKLATPGVKITGGRVYEFKVALLANFTAAGNSFTIRVRRDTPLTGPVVAEWSWQSGTAGFDDARTFTQEWVAPATAPAVPFFVTAVRAAGGGTMGVYGNRRSSFRVRDAGAGVWAEVA